MAVKARAKRAPKKSSAKKQPDGTSAGTTGTAESLPFQAEVGRLLDIVANSLYSEREVFLRELISNAADACDRLRYLAIETPELAQGDGDYRIDVLSDAKARILRVRDNGVGMNRSELVEHLGTIARSGSAAFVERLSGDSGKNLNLIGQFGVGFYAAFMVAERVDVLSRRAGEDDAWLWSSDGKGGFTVAPAGKAERGTDITLHLKEDAGEFLENYRLRTVIKTYSDHISFPIRLHMAGESDDANTDADEDKTAAEGEGEQVNAAAALWTQPKSAVEERQYTEFYRHVAHAHDEPWLVQHFRVEGVIAYAGLVFIPGERPFDLFHPERASKLKLYVRRVFITDSCEGLLPSWLRFLRGVIDCEDLPLNISREMLQNNPVVAKIRSGLVKRVLDGLEAKARDDSDSYDDFWRRFGLVLKEGLYETVAERERLLKLARFTSTVGDGLTDLAGYVARMVPGQDTIYYISGEDEAALANSPHLEGFAKKRVEVLLMTDPVDEFWIPACGEFDGKRLQSVTRGQVDLANIGAAGAADGDTDGDAPADKDQDDGQNQDAKNKSGTDTALDGLVIALKLALGEAVKDVRLSGRLSTSAVCLVADEGGMDIHLERLMRQHKQLERASVRILEINPDHALIRALGRKAGADGKGDLGDAASLLLDQARIIEGETLPDPAQFARRMAEVMTRALGD